MRSAFSRLITFINHLLAYAFSTLVELWIRRYVSQVTICDDTVVIDKREVVPLAPTASTHYEAVIAAGKLSLHVVPKEVKYGTR